MILFLFFLLMLPTDLAGAEEDAVLGTQAPEWEVGDWFNSPPLRLADLKGKVVLIRFWTAPHCHFCRASAPALNEFHEKYQKEGLQVIGLYHHKSAAPLDPKKVREYAEEFGFKFPVAIDYEWKTLRRWWLGRRDEAAWTSVSFLLDQQGTIRHVHEGGQYVKGDPDYAQLEAKIQELLKESGPHPIF